MTAQERCDLFDSCANVLKAGGQVNATAFGVTMYANSYQFSETDGNIASGRIGFLGTGAVPSFGSASLDAATAVKDNGDVTLSIAMITIGS